jgi:hypothetical protein
MSGILGTKLEGKILVKNNPKLKYIHPTPGEKSSLQREERALQKLKRSVFI